MTKIMTIVGTRPELIKMSLVIKKLEKYFSHTLVHTGQNYDYELNEIFYKDLDIKEPDFFLNSAKNNLADSIASIISNVDKVLSKIQPDAVLLYGDTNSCLSIIPAKRRKIPVFHMEAGNRCFDQNVPEEINRKIVDHLSDINFVLTEHARRYLISEGINKETIIKTGSHMREILNFHKIKIQNSKILQKLKLHTNKFFLVSAHREENVDNDNLIDLVKSLNKLAELYSFPIIFSTHPRTRKKLKSINHINLNNSIKFIKPLGFTDYIHLQQNALCCLSDSGTITEEADLLGINAINLRNTHERPEGNDAGTVIMSGLHYKRVLEAIRMTISLNKDKTNMNLIKDYQENYVSDKIVKNVLGYIDYVNKYIWKKNSE